MSSTNRSRGFLFAILLAGGASLASAQIGPYGISLSSSAGLGAPFALSPYGGAMPSGTGWVTRRHCYSARMAAAYRAVRVR